MSLLSLRTWPLWLGILAVMASPPDIEPNPAYARACPDYKRYSTFQQYVSPTLLRPQADIEQSTIFGGTNEITIPETFDTLPDLHIPSR